nr:methylated-DNA--[protein]-cysteine S-methyltransferase [Actinomyces oris]
MPYLSRYESPLGAMTMAGDGEYLTGLWFDGQKYDRSTISDDAVLLPHLPVFTQTAQWLDTYFGGTDPGFTPPIRVEGFDFKKMVTSIMLSIPFGATSTYARIAAEVARRMGRKQMSAQAVGGAVGRNPIVLIVPCHRVLASDGSLRGYAGGVDRKERLLEMEGVNVSGLLTPPAADDGGGRRE